MVLTSVATFVQFADIIGETSRATLAVVAVRGFAVRVGGTRVWHVIPLRAAPSSPVGHEESGNAVEPAA